MWFDPYIIYKNVFKKSPIEYYLKNIFYLLLFIGIGYFCNIICKFITINGILGLAIHGIVCVFVPIFIITILVSIVVQYVIIKW